MIELLYVWHKRNVESRQVPSRRKLVDTEILENCIQISYRPMSNVSLCDNWVLQNRLQLFTVLEHILIGSTGPGSPPSVHTHITTGAECLTLYDHSFKFGDNKEITCPRKLRLKLRQFIFKVDSSCSNRAADDLE